MMSLEFDGLDDLQMSIEELAKKYPDRAGEMLVKQAKDLRKDVVRMVKNDTDFNAESRRSLSKAKEYEISPVQGFGENQFVEISGKAPHFHLIENGHQIILPRTRTIKTKDGGKRKVAVKNGGASRGFVVGYNFMDRAGKKQQIKIPQELREVVNKLLKEEGFI